MSILEQTLGSLARNIPGATAVFAKHRLDFCCGGQKTLAQAAKHKQMDAEVVAKELDQLPSQTGSEVDWSQASDVELIEHILTRYHDTLREQLPELIRLSARVELVHGGHPACPAGLTNHLELMQEELEAHMQKEERILFPMISRGILGMTLGPMSKMRHEHDNHGAALSRLNHLTDSMTPPTDACNTWRALYAGLDALQLELMDHVHLENNVLFDRIEKRGETANG